MKKRSLGALALSLALLAAPATFAQAKVEQEAASLSSAVKVQGPHAASCAPGATKPALLLTVTGFKDQVGQVRVKAFRASEDEFLKSRKDLIRFDVPVPEQGDLTVCLPLPGGHPAYAVTVLHDRDMDGKTDLWSDGFGVSNNPRLRLGKPSVRQVAFQAPAAVGVMEIVLNYVSGLSVRPIRGTE